MGPRKTVPHGGLQSDRSLKAGAQDQEPGRLKGGRSQPPKAPLDNVSPRIHTWLGRHVSSGLPTLEFGGRAMRSPSFLPWSYPEKKTVPPPRFSAGKVGKVSSLGVSRAQERRISQEPMRLRPQASKSLVRESLSPPALGLCWDPRPWSRGCVPSLQPDSHLSSGPAWAALSLMFSANYWVPTLSTAPTPNCLRHP